MPAFRGATEKSKSKGDLKGAANEVEEALW